ncbi:MAG TPA: hypothetical protein VMF13_24395, partial [Luteitalea sp.]|nr:hypothetical protein [Luteitalea sp.]
SFARAQAPVTPVASPSEDVQPRIIGDAGTTALGFSGHVDRVFTIERETAFNYTVNVDVGHFLTRHLVVQGGVAGSGRIGGDADDLPSGSGVPALHAFGGALWYFTPRSLASLYSGAEYWSQVTQREGTDAGAVLAKIGLQGALSSRASLFVEGGYGIGLTRNDEGSPTRMVGRFGVRIKL